MITRRHRFLRPNRYDHLDRRVQKITPAATHTYFYDGWMLIKEIVANTNGTTDVIEYHWGKDLSGTIGGAGGVGGLLYLSISNSSTPNSSTRQLYVPFYDAYGNVMGYWDAQGNVVAEYTYDAFGKLISSSGPMADVSSFRYSTKYYDPETGLYYYGYRFYSPELMRWITRDPIGEEGGVNLYAMCGNNLVNSYDRLGLARMLTGNLVTADYAFISMTEGKCARDVMRFILQLMLAKDQDNQSHYDVKIKDFALANRAEILRDVNEHGDDVYFIAHGRLQVNGVSFKGRKWERQSKSDVAEDYYDPACDGKIIRLSSLGPKLNRSNTFGCFVSPRVRIYENDVLVSASEDSYAKMYTELLKRLQRYPLGNIKEKCRRKIIIYEGELGKGRPDISSEAGMAYFPRIINGKPTSLIDESLYDELREEYFLNGGKRK